MNDLISLPAAQQLLAMLQMGDSFFPSGMYTQSHGLERWIERGARGPARIEPLLQMYLLHVAAPAEALAARHVNRAAASGDLELVQQIDQRVEAGRLASEGRDASRRCGGRILLLGAELYPRSLLGAYAAQVRAGHAPGHQSVAMAMLAAAAGLEVEAAVLLELHTFAVSLVGAAVRLGALDHIAAQHLLVRARPLLQRAADLGRDRPWQSIGSFAPHIDVMQFQHRFADMHMFVS